MSQPDQGARWPDRSADPTAAARVELLSPGPAGLPLSVAALRAMSAALQRPFGAVQLNAADLLGVAAPAVLPGQLLARLIHPSGQPSGPLSEAAELSLEVGAHVTLSPAGEYRAARYGYLCLQEGCLSIQSPLWLAPRAMQAYWLLLDQRPQPLNLELVHQCLADQGIVEGIRQDDLGRLVEQVRRGGQERGIFLVAAGTEPIRGRDARVEILVEQSPSRKRGIPPPPRVTAGQLVARRSPPAPGLPGRNVRGQEIPAEPGRPQPLIAGPNLRMESRGDTDEFYATAEGACRVWNDEIAVVRLLAIQGDVSPKTGNINFTGEVHVAGSVLKSMSVKATHSITVVGWAEADTMLVAQGDVVVGQGIAGRRTRVIARRDVRAGSVREATIAATRDIVLEHYALRAYLRAGRSVVVNQGEDRNGGSIAGGQTWAQQGIDLYSAGSEDQEPTLLAVGLTPEQAHMLNRIESNLKLTSTHIQRLLEQFGIERLDLEQIRRQVDSATGARYQILKHRVQYLSQLVQAYQHLREQRRELQEQWGPELSKKEIRVRETAYPGVEIRLGEHRATIAAMTKNLRYRVQGDRLVS